MFNRLFVKYYSNNTTLNPGALGDVIATEDIAGVKYELVKVLFGGNGVATKVDASNPLPVTDAVAEAALASIAAEDFSTHAAQTDGSQKTQIVDGSGNVVTVTGNKLDVNATFGGTVSENVAQLGGNAIDTNSGVVGAGTQRVTLATNVALPVGANIIGKVGIDQTTPGTTNGVVVNSSALPSGAATSAAQTDKSQFTKLTDGTDTALITASGEQNVIATAQPGIDIGDVTVNNASGGSAVNIQDGGNSITIDSPGLPTALGQAVMASSMPVVIASDQSAVPTTEAPPTTIFNGKTTVTTAGTRVTLSGSTTIKSVTVKALSTNTGFIYVGNATVAASNGHQLLAGDSISMDIANLTTVNIDSSVNGEGVTYFGVN